MIAAGAGGGQLIFLITGHTQEFQEVWQHPSSSTGTLMNVGVYLPPQALAGEKCPVLYWLSGLTCTEQNFITKAGAQQHAARHGLILVAPDTNPRSKDVADDEG